MNTEEPNNFNDIIQASIDHLLKDQSSQAIALLKRTIKNRAIIDVQDFVGWGNKQCWDEHYPKGPLQWFRQEGKNIRNIYDLLSVTFMIGQHTKSITMSEIITVYQELSFLVPDKMFQIHMGLGNAYHNDWQFLKAEKQYMLALEIKQTEKVCQYITWIKNEVFSHSGTEACTIEYAQRCLSFNSENIEAILAKATCKKDKVAAKQIIDILISKYPKYYRLYLEMGFLTQNNLKQQLGWLEKALQLDPCYLRAIVCKALWIEKTSPEQTPKIFQEALEKYPESDFLWSKYGNHLMKHDNNEKAIQCHERAIKLNPFRFSSRQSLGDIYRENNNPAKSLGKYLEYIQLNPYNCWIYNSMAVCYYQLKNYTQELNCYLKGLELDPNNSTILGNIGKYHVRNDDNNVAVEWFVKVHEVQPTADNCLMIAKCYGRVATLQLIDTIKLWADRCIEMGCDSEKEVYSYLSQIYLYLFRNYDKAVQMFLKAACERKKISQPLNIIELFHQNLSFVEKVNVLKKHMNAEMKYENIYWFLQLSTLFEGIHSIQNEKCCLNAVRVLAKGRDDVDPIIKVALRCPFWLKGKLEEEDQVNYILLMQSYSNKFSEHYS